MSVFDTLRSKIGLTKATNLPSDVAPYLYSAEYDTVFGVDPSTDAASWLGQYGSVGWVYIANKIVATRAAGADLTLFKLDAQGVQQQIRKHLWLDVLTRPNDMMSQYQLWMLLYLHLGLTGEAFWYVNRNALGGPAAVYPLIPSFMKVVPGTGQSMVAGYIYDINGEQAMFDPTEIVHFFYPNPDPSHSFYHGASPLSALQYAIATYTNAEIYNYQFFQNGARPGGYLATDQPLERSEVRKLRMMWEQQHQGQTKWHKVAVASHGLLYKELGLSQKDMDFVNQLNNARDIILAAYGVPKSLVSSSESSANRALAVQEEINFVTGTIGPLLNLVASTLNTFLLPQFDQNIRCEFHNIIPRDEQVTTQTESEHLKQAVRVVNEIRADHGWGPVAWGNEPIIPVNYAPLSMIQSGQVGVGNNPIAGPPGEPGGKQLSPADLVALLMLRARSESSVEAPAIEA